MIPMIRISLFRDGTTDNYKPIGNFYSEEEIAVNSALSSNLRHTHQLRWFPHNNDCAKSEVLVLNLKSFLMLNPTHIFSLQMIF